MLYFKTYFEKVRQDQFEKELVRTISKYSFEYFEIKNEWRAPACLKWYPGFKCKQDYLCLDTEQVNVLGLSSGQPYGFLEGSGISPRSALIFPS